MPNTTPLSSEPVDTYTPDPLDLAELAIQNGHPYPGMERLTDASFCAAIFGAIKESGNKQLAYGSWVLDRCVAIQAADQNAYLSLVITQARDAGIYILDFERAITHHREQASRNATLPLPQSATALLAKHFDPLEFYVSELIHEGLILLAGKPKKGKSYLALDMSLALSVGRLAFRHFPTKQARVLYVSLEDGPRRLQSRLRKIQPNITSPPGLDFLYEFPRLGAGALEALTHYANEYTMIIIDVLGRILPTIQSVRKNVNEYQEYTELLGGIQSLANDKHIAIMLIDHVRKAGADDVYDTIMGSQGKWGTADIGLVYERKGEDKDAVLHVAGREVEEQKFVLTLTDGHLAFLGKGESYELDSEQNRIIKILEEERRPMGIPDIMKMLGILESHYGRFRVVMHRLFSEDRVGRTKRGLYTLYGHDRADDVMTF